ncbi:MAG: CRISPR-associated endoribonuclease Cas6, partial [Abitibacteriaceae bacterium]|nr:CRISPR-associated endoribonuclease Cas6 [Abditibacteriaceae bacterium]
LQPGAVEWYVASPVEKFLQEFATGLLACHRLQVGQAALPIAQVETLPPPEFSATMHLKCLSPIVVGVGETSDGQRKTRYLRPKDPGWSERIGQNLLGKYAALHGGAPPDTRLALHFDPEYLAIHKGTKLITYKDIQMVGAFAPLRLTGSPDLVRIGYECGLGEKNAGGCGMVEVVKSAVK